MRATSEQQSPRARGALMDQRETDDAVALWRAVEDARAGAEAEDLEPHERDVLRQRAGELRQRAWAAEGRGEV